MNELQIAIEMLINENGGTERYANLIESEWVKSTVRRVVRRPRTESKIWETHEVNYIKENYANLTMWQMSIYLNRTYQSIESKIHRMREFGLLNGRRYAKRRKILEKLNLL